MILLTQDRGEGKFIKHKTPFGKLEDSLAY
jgi:hypothetical protein